jgi:hypothetical protein
VSTVVASVDGSVIPVNCPGAALLISSPSEVDWTETLSGAATVRLQRMSRSVLVTDIMGSHSLDDLPAIARDYANQALDLMSIRSVASYRLADSRSPYVCWIPTSLGPTMRMAFEAQMTFKMTAGGGPTAYPLMWHESMRYFRMSQITIDVFDAFRNLYLALESILSHIAPVQLASTGRPIEGEAQWTRRALQAADAVLRGHNAAMTIGRYLKQPGSQDEVSDVFDELYKAVRTSIFHAKNGRVFVLPQNQRDRAQVLDALSRYVILYTDLAEAALGGRFLRSGLASGGFAAAASIMADWEVGVSCEDYPNLDRFDQEAAARIAAFSTQRVPALDQDFRAAILGTTHVSNLLFSTPVLSVAARTRAGEPVTVESLATAVTVEGVHELQCLLTFEALSSGAKTRYDT